MIITFVLHILHKYKSVIMKINWDFENVHVHIKIYINMKIIKKITLANGIRCSISLQLYLSDSRKVTSKLVSVNMNEIYG